jgi:shikimate kinase
MRLNTELVERTMGYSYRTLRNKLEQRGAIASGVSGLGPTLAAIAPTSHLSRLAGQLPDDGAERKLVSFVAAPTCGGRVP